jgi:methanogenic corrinoid protein MtbC1
MIKVEEIAQAVENGKLKLITALVQTALVEGMNPNTILNDGLIRAMGVVGAKFQRSEVFVPDMLISAKTMKKGVDALQPHLAGCSDEHLGKCIIGTVYGEQHDLGKNLVALVIESVGFEVLDLGIDVPVAVFVNAIKANPDVKLVALSCGLRSARPAMKETAAAIRASGLGGFKLIVGGAPVTRDFAAEIGADAYAKDAASAALLARQLVS